LEKSIKTQEQQEGVCKGVSDCVTGREQGKGELSHSGLYRRGLRDWRQKEPPRVTFQHRERKRWGTWTVASGQKERVKSKFRGKGELATYRLWKRRSGTQSRGQGEKRARRGGGLMLRLKAILRPIGIYPSGGRCMGRKCGGGGR